VDFSAPLLSAAAQSYTFPVRFAQADLTSDGWALSFSPAAFHLVFAFAVLHHIPSEGMRLNILKAVRNVLREDGKFIMSNWQFLNSEKLRKRIQSWQQVNLRADEVDEGDYLLDWRSGGTGLRYAHHFSDEELSALANQAAMRVSARFLSDGEGGNLGLYQVWERL
jgi:SAM-dependent methyltransferase